MHTWPTRTLGGIDELKKLLTDNDVEGVSGSMRVLGGALPPVCASPPTYKQDELATDEGDQGDQDVIGAYRCTVPSGSVLVRSDPKSVEAASLLKEMSEIADQQLRLAEVVLTNGEMHVTQSEIPRYVTMEVVLDSGAGAHVANKRHVPWYNVVPSALSKLGAAFVAADGGKIDNQGEALLNLVTLDSKGSGHAVRANFQIADATRALWSVGLICDSGLQVKFAAMTASILDPSG